MKRWRKGILAVCCVLCMGILAGCGSEEKETERTQETSGVKETENENLPDQGGASDSTEGTVNGVTDRDSKEESEDRDSKEDGRDDGKDLTDRAGDAGKDLIDGAGDAGKDLIDGVGDAGKDVIDGVEDAGDALTNP